MDEDKISSDNLEIIVEEITREVLKRICREGVDISLERKCGKDYACTGDMYTCPKSYTCLGKKHSCTGVFECSVIHKWEATI